MMSQVVKVATEEVVHPIFGTTTAVRIERFFPDTTLNPEKLADIIIQATKMSRRAVVSFSEEARETLGEDWVADLLHTLQRRTPHAWEKDVLTGELGFD